MLMINIEQTEREIQNIVNIFRSCKLEGSKNQILESLSQFEHQTSSFMSAPHLAAIIRWHKNLFLQKTGHFPRAEQLLDEALDLLEGRSEPLFQYWKLKIYLSLGYVHLSLWNYFDAESYLEDALELGISEPSLTRFLGEIYSGLSAVTLYMGRNNQSKRYAVLEKEKSYENYRANPTDESLACTYAFALVNYSRITRLVGLMDPSTMDYIEESIQIFSRLKREKGLLLARLEKAEFHHLTDRVDTALDAALDLAPIFREKGMGKESMQAGLLAAKIYRKMLDYEHAETTLNDLFAFAKERQSQNDPVVADALFEMGLVYYAISEEAKAIEYYRASAKVGMVLGIKNIIVRSFNAVRSIDRYKAKELLTSDLVYEDAMFVRNRIGRTINPFKESRSKAKVFASTLFVDIVGFSRMMKQSDEGLAVRMIDELVDRMYLIIYQHNGYIDKFLGDGFMAIFEHGYTLDPDAAFNAVKCGMDIHRALNHKNRKLRKVYGADKNIQVRIGISTGEIYAILLGNYIKTEFTYLGNSVNLASKLESLATKQFMLIDEQTRALVEKRIFADPEKILIPGLGETTTYRVLRLTRSHERPFSGERPEDSIDDRDSQLQETGRLPLPGTPTP